MQNNWNNMDDAGELELAEMVDTSVLSSVIDSSKSVVDAAVVGNQEGEYPQETVDAANAAIASAEAVLAEAETQAAVDAAVADLRDAMALFLPNTVAVKELLKQEFSMYPVPAGNLLHIKGVSNVDLVSLYAVTGQLIKVRTINEDHLTLDLSDLEPGMYMIKFNTDKGTAVRSIVKQ